ncbi:hypothetical protein K0F43_21305 [Bacteroides fragilis]|nr:hypothetical protein [Bacteroides fragilis]MCE8767222.1 hypothetical protein [Bacteroides fragilis]
MIKSNFQIETKKLCKIESELLKLISDSGNESLQNKFLEWQEQRDICNEVLITELERHVNQETTKHKYEDNSQTRFRG